MKDKIAVIQTSAKCSDMCWLGFENKDGKQVGQYDGYVPDFFPGEHYGDYVMLKIDVETGKILDWQKPTQAELKELIAKHEEQEKEREAYQKAHQGS